MKNEQEIKDRIKELRKDRFKYSKMRDEVIFGDEYDFYGRLINKIDLVVEHLRWVLDDQSVMK